MFLARFDYLLEGFGADKCYGQRSLLTGSASHQSDRSSTVSRGIPEGAGTSGEAAFPTRVRVVGMPWVVSDLSTNFH